MSRSPIVAAGRALALVARVAAWLGLAIGVAGATEPPPLTSLSDPAVRYRLADKPYVVLKRSEIEAVIADNRPVDDAVLPGHRRGYSGIASLKHARRRENLFAPPFAGLNLEHIHDGAVQPWDVLFEPRRAPMELRVVDSSTAELCQKPTPHYGLESCLRYHLLEDGAIENGLRVHSAAAELPQRLRGPVLGVLYPPARVARHPFQRLPCRRAGAGTMGAGRVACPRRLSTHLAADNHRSFAHDPGFPLTLVFNFSKYRYSEPWCYGVSHGMALALMFRPRDRIRMSQSPSGAGGQSGLGLPILHS